MPAPLERLTKLLMPAPLAPDRYRGEGSRDDGAPNTYGGHLLGQAAAAALASVEEGRVLHAVHAQFLRAGEPGVAYEYAVTRVRDGRSFSTRRVGAWQGERLVLELTASLCVPATGPSLHDTPPPDFAALPAPDELPDYLAVMSAHDPMPLPEEWVRRETGIAIRPINAPWTAAGLSPAGGMRHWIRAEGPLPENSALASAMLVYQSDESLADTALLPFDLTWGTPGLTCVSLDHALWQHRAVSFEEWLLVEQWPGAADHGRGLAHGRVWRRDGSLIATFAQEVLIRFDDGRSG